MVADESDPMIDAGSIGDIHNRESTPYLLCGHTKQLLSHFPKPAQAVGGGDCRDSSRFPFRVCLMTGFPSATVFAVEDGGGKL